MLGAGADKGDDTAPSRGLTFARDIVELVIFSTDEVFLQTLREAVGGSRRLWYVPSADKVGDLLLAGQVGILVLDVQALSEPASAFVARIKLQFPELVVVVAGHREDEGSLANLISGGSVYRFLHKPLSPGRAKLFVDAAVRKYAEQHRPFRAAPRAKPLANRRLFRGGAVAAMVLVALAAGLWALRQRAASQAEDELARAALPAATGLSAAQERLLARVENALLEDRLGEAAASIEAARNAGVDGNRIAYLTAQLARSREQIKAAAARAKQWNEARLADAAPAQPSTAAASSTAATSTSAPVRPTAAPAGDNHVTDLLHLAAQRIEDGRLIEPSADCAALYVKQALQIDPDGNGTQAARETLAIALLAELHAAIDHREFGRAASLLDAADGIVAPANLESNRQLLAAAHAQANAPARDQLLRSGQERLRQDRLLEPVNDNAKYYLTTLRELDPAYPGLAAAVQDLGFLLVMRARHALEASEYEAARSALDEAVSLGYSSPESNAARAELAAATHGG